ncbi:MAG TPA: MFS transporter [Actinomycetes bacterium]|nr:MFS transporter [Actinomycetes bacterium]
MRSATKPDHQTQARPATSWRFWTAGAALLVLLLGANLPTPLYAVYRQRFGFSSAVLTLIFATYAVVLIPSLLLFGQLSDRIGRRRVIALGLGAAALALLLFAAARGTAWLFAARAVQGLAVGATTGTATAALVELEPGGDEATAALAATLGQAGGGAAGPVIAGLLAQWAPAPRTLCYLVGLVATVGVGVTVLRLPEPHPPGGHWRPQLPSVRAGQRARFARAGLTAGSVWAVGALFLSVVPLYASTLLKTGNLALLGGITAVMLATACAAQVVSLRRGLPPATGQFAGLVLLVAGLAALVAAFPPRSLALLLVAAVLAGAGLGLGYVGAQTRINQLAPPERRGEVTAAFITCVYTGVTIAAVSVGLLSDALSLFAAVAIVAVAIAATATATTAWHRTGEP